MIDIDEIIKITTLLIEISKKISANPTPEKSGGYLTIVLNNFEEVKVLPIGTYPKEKEEKYFRLSQEKAHRLYAHWLRDKTAISSFQTRDESKMQLGGAVLFEKDSKINLISFSGLHEKLDELISVILGIYLNLADKEFAEEIIKISDNYSFKEMLEKFNIELKNNNY